MKAVVQHFIGTSRQWQEANPKLYQAVWGFEITAKGPVLAKLGDGVHLWNDLPYWSTANIHGLPERLAAIEELAAEAKTIAENDSFAYPVELDSQTPTREQLQAAYEAVSGKTGEPPDMTILEDPARSKAYKYFKAIGEWVDMGGTGFSQFTNTALGMIKGSTNPGEIAALESGAGKVNGWAALVTELAALAAGTPGTFIFSGIQSAAIRAQHRLLDLTGQIIAITGTYAALAANVYVGDATNSSAGAFYKCDASGNRSTSGAYMKMPDCRGIFLRGTGAQTRTITWTDSQGVSHSINTTYDGGSIAQFIGDAIRLIQGGYSNYVGGGDNRFLLAGSFSGVFRAMLDNQENLPVLSVAGVQTGSRGIYFSSDRVVPTAGDNHPASVSAMICITY
jgi:hypothetical protein